MTEFQVLIILAQNEEGLLRQLALMDISVPPIEQGRTTQHCEKWSICRLLATLIKYHALEFPIKVTKGERPDFCLHTGQKQIGIEFTEAIQPDYARARVLPEAKSDESTIDGRDEGRTTPTGYDSTTNSQNWSAISD